METSVIACRNLHDKIYCVPYIGEKNCSHDNCPIEFTINDLSGEDIFARNISKKYMNDHFPGSMGFPVIDNHILLEKQDPENPMPTIGNDFDFYHWVIPRIYQMLKNDPEKGFYDADNIKTYRIMAFTHYGFIRSHFGFNRQDTVNQQFIDSGVVQCDDKHHTHPLVTSGPRIQTDPRFRDQIDQYISPDYGAPSPHNVNIYTENLELVSQIPINPHNDNILSLCRVIKTQMADPCDCVSVRKCRSNHQIKISDQVVDQKIMWKSLTHCDVKRCLHSHPLFKKYYDKISYIREYDECKKNYKNLKHI